jgi:hypothetical protein
MKSETVIDFSPTRADEHQDACVVHRGLHNQVVLLRLGQITLVNYGLLSAIGGAIASFLILARQFQAGMQPMGNLLLFLLLNVLAISVPFKAGQLAMAEAMIAFSVFTT